MNVDTSYKYAFEKIAYTNECSFEIKEAILKNIFILDEQVLYYKEIPVVSDFSINLCFDKVEELGSAMKNHGLVIDITETAPPRSRVRRTINTRFKKICETVDHVSFYTGRNILINTSARFVMFQTNLDSFSIHKTQLAAINAIKKNLNG